MTTPQQVKLQAWLCIINGAKGLHWYPYQGAPTPANYAAMAAVVSDTTALTDVILSPELSDLSTSDQTGNIFATARTMGGNLYVFVANTAKVANTCQFNTPQIRAGQQVQLYPNGRKFTANSGSFTDTVPAEGVQIYLVKSGASQQPSNLRIIKE